MSWFDDAREAVSDGLDSASDSVSSWFGPAPETSDVADGRGSDTLYHGDEPESLWGQIGQTVGDLGRGIQQEGIGGLLDPGGMLDRQDAQRELSNRFQVVDEDFVGPRQSNQVTQAEYEDIARSFSDIRLGRGDLTIDSSRFSPFAGEDRENWEEGIQADLADMMMTEGGRSQIAGLQNNVVRDDSGDARTMLPFGLGPEVHHHTTIEPLFGERDSPGDDWEDPWFWERDASTLRTDNAFARPEGSGSRRDAAGNRGSGTDSTILINPGNILSQGVRSDVVMSHEMQHATHQTQGTNAFGKFGSGSDTNINNSERQATGLTRSDSPTGGHYPGDPDGCTENDYRMQSNALGDRFLPRTQYAGSMPAEAPSTMSDSDFEALWNSFLTGPNVAP